MAALVREVLAACCAQARMSQGRDAARIVRSAGDLSTSVGDPSAVARAFQPVLSAFVRHHRLPLSVVAPSCGRMASRAPCTPPRLAEQPAPPLTPAPRSSLRQWCRWRPKVTESTRCAPWVGAMRADPINWATGRETSGAHRSVTDGQSVR